jgi:hypothetical protein
MLLYLDTDDPFDCQTMRFIEQALDAYEDSERHIKALKEEPSE